MFRNYLMCSLRSLKKDKFYVIVNQLSLAMAFALCTIGFFNFMFNQTYNHSFDDHVSVYKLNAKSTKVSASQGVGISPIALRDAVVAQHPELKIGRYHRGEVNVKIGDLLIRESVGYVDPSFIEIIHFSKNRIAMGSGQVILTDQAAERLFGRQSSAVGQLLEVHFPGGKKKLMTVGQVIPKPNENTSFQFSMLLPMDSYIHEVLEADDDRWSHWISGTFLKLDGSDVESVEKALNEFLEIQNSHNPELELDNYQLHNLTEWAHLERELHGRSFGVVLHPASVVGTMSSAFAILLLACFNFFNTTIATSGRRLKEISMRKVIGGSRRDIIVQYMLESAIQVVMAFFISLLLSYFLIGAYNAMFRFELVQFQRDYLTPYLIFSISICLLTVLLSGAYPAFYVSRFPSLDILKNKTKFKGNSMITKCLLALQFAVCVYNIYSLGVFVENSYYQETMDRGYEVRKFINIPVSSDQLGQLENKITESSKFEFAVGTKDLVGFSHDETSFEYEGVSYTCDKLEVGEGYLSGLGVQFLQGQDFIEGKASNDHLVLINESFNQLLGGNLLGEYITLQGRKYRVHGLTADFNLKTIMLSNKIKPTIFFHSPDSLNRYAVVSCDEQNLIPDNERLEKIWYSLFPDQLYEGFYQERVFENVNQTNQIMTKINLFIAVVSILISILGLYALISLTIQRRIKEIGIRKTLGASFSHILKLLISEVSWMMLISIVLGLAFGQYVISQLLDIIYAYHIKIDWLNSAFAVVVILWSAVVSIGFKVVKTVKMNPVTQLRSE